MLLAFTAALAAEPFNDEGVVLQPGAESVFAAGVGAPTVEWDGTQFLMYFESPAPEPQIPEGCGGAYQIGRATSPDGLVWTPETLPSFSFGGAEGTTRYCSVAQPAVLFDGTLWNLFWSSSREPAAGSTANQPTGIGWATSSDGLTWNVQAETLVPFTGTAMGLASAAAVNGLVYLIWSEYPNLFVITRPAKGGAWSPPMLAIDHELLGDWGSEWALGPSIVCAAESAAPLRMLFGADQAETFSRSLAWATTTDGSTWTVDEAGPLTGGTLEYGALNHWEALSYDGGGTRLWYSRSDTETGTKFIGSAWSGAAGGEPQPRLCPNPYAPADTGLPDDSGAADTADTQGGTDTNTPGLQPDGCGCNGAAERGASVVGVAALALAAMRRRR